MMQLEQAASGRNGQRAMKIVDVTDDVTVT